ncbi:hypothetical protein ACLKA7_001091 [Drosophila subpalustris]
MHPRLDRFRHYQQQPQQQQQQQQQPPQRVLFVTRRPEPRPAQEPIIVVIDDATLKAFVRCVYIVAAIFILVTSITWLAISWTEFDFYAAVPVPSFAWILLAFFLLMVMNCVPPVRRIFPINWGITICILVLIIFAGACLVGSINVLNVLAALLRQRRVSCKRMLTSLVSLSIMMMAICQQQQQQ